jgi:hypothetical protein
MGIAEGRFELRTRDDTMIGSKATLHCRMDDFKDTYHKRGHFALRLLKFNPASLLRIPPH